MADEPVRAGDEASAMPLLEHIPQNGWAASAPALRSRNFRIFWAGQLISIIGTAVQTVAEGWLVYELTGSTFWLGMVGLLGLLPVLPISFVGGLLIDRVPRRKLILATQVGLLLQAALFGLLATSGQLGLWQIIVLYFVFGALLAIDHPARRAFLVELVPTNDLANAIALNATAFNLSSIIGYGVAGVMIAAWGAGLTISLNALTYVAPIVAMLLIRVSDVRADVAPAALGSRNKIGEMRTALLEGAMTLLRQPTILLTISVMAVVGGLAYPVLGMMPAYAEDVLRTGAVGLGILWAASALGSVLGTVAVARLGQQHRGKTLALVALLLPIAVAAFAGAHNLWLSCLLLVIIGLMLLILQSLAITLVQLHIPDRVRGRVMSIYSLLHAGSDTMGNVLVGSAAVWLGLPWALAAGAGTALLYALVVGWWLPHVRQLD